MTNNITGLRAEKLSVGYGKTIVVDDINFEIIPGKITTLIGPNGSGKTTILKTLLRQIEPLMGCIYLSDSSVKNMKNQDIARLMAMVTTKRPHTDMMTCRDVVSTGRYPYTGHLGILSDNDNAEVDKAMDFMQVNDIADRDFLAVSDGQKQRIMLARAICQNPKVLILDEPTSFLDIKFKLDILKSIYKLSRNENVSVIMSLHELDLARGISDEIICVEDGRIGKIGTPKDIFTGGYIQKLYGIDKECFDEEKGMLLMPKWDD